MGLFQVLSFDSLGKKDALDVDLAIGTCLATSASWQEAGMQNSKSCSVLNFPFDFMFDFVLFLLYSFVLDPFQF